MTICLAHDSVCSNLSLTQLDGSSSVGWAHLCVSGSAAPHLGALLLKVGRLSAGSRQMTDPHVSSLIRLPWACLCGMKRIPLESKRKWARCSERSHKLLSPSLVKANCKICLNLRVREIDSIFYLEELQVI